MEISTENLSRIINMYHHLMSVAASGGEREKNYALYTELPQLKRLIPGNLQDLSNLENNLRGVFPEPY
ncbi:MAG TPA: hypothetical protein VMC80_02235 [Patescibacteria group bacterium]|nr:hypothetical protein [Patescibacteria group bacterium]